MTLVFSSGAKRWTTKRADRALGTLDKLRRIIFEIEGWDTLPMMKGVNEAVAGLQTAIIKSVNADREARTQKRGGS